MTYKALPKLNPFSPQVYARIDDDKLIRVTCIAENPEFQAWLEEGNEPLPADEPELTWDDIRSERDRLIAESDWTMTPGATVNQHDWAVYRQILRDIPQTFKGQEPSAVTWPEKPSADGPNVRAVEVALRAAEDAAAAAVKVTSTAKINEEQTES